MSFTDPPATLQTQGTTLWVGDDVDGDATTQIAGVASFDTIPGFVVDKYERTRVDQTNGDGSIDYGKYYAPGREDRGSLKCGLGAKADGLRATEIIALKRLRKLYMLKWNDGSSVSFPGWLMSFSPKADKAGEVMYDIEIVVDGEPDWEEAS